MCNGVFFYVIRSFIPWAKEAKTVTYVKTLTCQRGRFKKNLEFEAKNPLFVPYSNILFTQICKR